MGEGKKIDIKNGEIIMSFAVSPELGRMAIREGLEMPFVVWSILRAFAVAQKSSTHFTKKEASEIVAQNGLQFTARHWRNLWAKGHGIFWGMDSQRIYLVSYRRLALKFQAFIKPCDLKLPGQEKFVEISLSGRVADVRAKLYWAWFLQWPEKTISRDTLRDLFGMSHDQQRAAEVRLGGLLLVKSNYAHIDLEAFKQNPESLPEHHFTIQYEREVRFDEDVDTVQAIQYQMPNSFIGRAGSGNPFPVSDASNRAKKAMRTLNRQFSSLFPLERTFWLKWSEFEALGTMESFVRAYYQGKKRLWLSGNYL